MEVDEDTVHVTFFVGVHAKTEKESPVTLYVRGHFPG
jgi:hypothetical protein